MASTIILLNILLLFVLALTLTSFAKAEEFEDDSGDGLFQFSVEDGSGNVVPLSQYRSAKVILVG